MKKLLVLFFCLSSFLFAHKLNLFTTYEDETLFISVYFANGKGCKNCKITIKDKDEKVLLKAKTNKKGEFTTNLYNDSVIVSVDAGGGHIVSDYIELIKSPKSQVLELKEEKEVKKNDNELIEKLKKENQELKNQIKVLEEKSNMMDIYKTLLGLLVIALIFLFLKRVKSE